MSIAVWAVFRLCNLLGNGFRFGKDFRLGKLFRLLCQLFFDCANDRRDIGKGKADEDKEGVVYDIYKPTVLFRKVRKARLRRADNVHKVHVCAATRFVQHTVDIECEEH